VSNQRNPPAKANATDEHALAGKFMEGPGPIPFVGEPLDEKPRFAGDRRPVRGGAFRIEHEAVDADIGSLLIAAPGRTNAAASKWCPGAIAKLLYPLRATRRARVSRAQGLDSENDVVG
jgi:hypothetical protein